MMRTVTSRPWRLTSRTRVTGGGATRAGGTSSPGMSAGMNGVALGAGTVRAARHDRAESVRTVRGTAWCARGWRTGSAARTARPVSAGRVMVIGAGAVDASSTDAAGSAARTSALPGLAIRPNASTDPAPMSEAATAGSTTPVERSTDIRSLYALETLQIVTIARGAAQEAVGVGVGRETPADELDDGVDDELDDGVDHELEVDEIARLLTDGGT